MNNELLIAVAKHIESLPAEQFNMGYFADLQDCGTVACIAGHACLMKGYKLNLDEDGDVEFDEFIEADGIPVSAPTLAKRLLELDYYQGENLFYSDNWNGDAITVTNIVARIDQFIATDGAE